MGLLVVLHLLMGITWDQNLKHSLGGDASHEWEIIINRPFVLKRAIGECLVWEGSLPPNTKSREKGRC